MFDLALVNFKDRIISRKIMTNDIYSESEAVAALNWGRAKCVAILGDNGICLLFCYLSILCISSSSCSSY